MRRPKPHSKLKAKPMATLSETIADWVAKCSYEDLPIESIEIAKRNILDCIGTSLAGSMEPVARVLKKYLKSIKCPKQATVIGMGIRASCNEAAMANGIMAHALDYDDLVIPATGAGGPHITSAILPAALAVAENQRKTGKDLILAYILGCEIAYRIGRAVDPTHYNSGWHTTGTEGIFGAVVAASKLLNISKTNIVYALGIAASEASGLRENFGTMTKFLHAGQAAAKGVRAALLAKYGYMSSKTVFEGESGFCNVFSKEPKPEEIIKDLGEIICISQIRLKLYPCCAASHSAIYATQQIMSQSIVNPHEIVQIKVHCDPQMSKILTFHKPKTIDEAKFSVQFPLAMVCMGKKVILSEFNEKNLKDPDIVQLMAKIQLIPKNDLKARSVHSRSAQIEIKLNDGTDFIERCDHPPGTPQNKILAKDIFDKYRTCASFTLNKDDIEKTYLAFMTLENFNDLDSIFKIIGKHKI